MVDAGVDKAHREKILGHSLKGMDVHYVKPPDSSFMAAMDKYTEWLDAQIKVKLQTVDHFVDQDAV
jgi:cytochrome c